MKMLAVLLSILNLSCTLIDTNSVRWRENAKGFASTPLQAGRDMLAINGAPSNQPDAPYGRSHLTPPDPVEVLRQHPDYVEQRVRGVGLAAWGGPIRLDLEINQQTRSPTRSAYVDRAIFAVGTDPLSGRIEVALAPYLHPSEQEARRAISQQPFSSPEFVFYSHYRGIEGIIFPTIVSETTAPRLIRAVRALLDHEASNTRMASSVLLESFMLAAGLRYPLPTRPGTPATGRLVMDTGRRLSANELAIAIKLVSEGRTVRVLAESSKRTADFLIDGIPTELKTISSITSKDLSGALARRILDGAGQAGHIIVDVQKQAGMSLELAEQAVRRAYGADKVRRIQHVRMIGRDFDFTVPRKP